MKMRTIIFLSLFCFSFSPSAEKAAIENAGNGFYISVKDLTDRTYHEFIIENKDSANVIFKKYFMSELDLGDVNYPISIYNGKRDFYIARVNVFVKANGKKNFKHLKYPDVYIKDPKKRAPVPEVKF